MTPKYFVEILKKVVQEQAVKDIIENLLDPPGKNPSQDLIKLGLFYSNLNKDEKALLIKILNEATEMTLFGLLSVLDGVRAIENGEEKGNLELWYRKGEETILINDIDEEFLHDLI